MKKRLTKTLRFILLGFLLIILAKLSIPYFESYVLANDARKNGFSLDPSLVPNDKILQGGPPKDGIPAILEPKFIGSAKARKSFSKKERAIVVRWKSTVKAYPISILNWHEIVNDKIEGDSIVITYCPLCGTGIVFNANINGKPHTFGVSGLLYQSDVLLYDHQTESLWSQIMRKAVTGKYLGNELQMVGSEIKNLHDQIGSYPNTQVLSKQTGLKGVFRNYDKDPYEGYTETESLYFPVDRSSLKTGVPLKDWSIIILTLEDPIIVPLSSLPRNQTQVSIPSKNGDIELKYDHKKRLLSCVDATVECLTGYYFALQAFHPNAKVVSLQ